MLKKIVLFMPPYSRCGVLHQFTRDLNEAFVRAGIASHLLESEFNNPAKFVDAIFAAAPDCTLSFNGLLPDEQGRFFSDLVKIPHVACLVDSPNSFVQLAQNKRTIITCVDRFYCQFYRGMGMKHVTFMPHATNSLITPGDPDKKKYDAVLLASFLDYEVLRSKWTEKYPTAVHWALHEAAEESLRDANRSYVEIFAEAFDRQLRSIGGVDPSQIDLVAILQDLEDYINAKDRVELVKSLQGIRLDIFGTAQNSGIWEKFLGKEHSNITVHDAIPYTEALEVMKQSRVILNSCPKLRLGGHERVFSGAACGAAVVSSDSSYLRETFTNGKDIILYQYGDSNGVNNAVRGLLSDESRRRELADRSRAIVMAHHTWDHRAAELLAQLPHMLEAIKEELSSAIR